MEDHFLYKLRNGQLQNNRNNYKSKKVIDYKKDGKINFETQKQLGKLLEKVLDFQKHTLTCLEKIVEFQEKQSKTMLKIDDSLKLLNNFIINNYSKQSNILSSKNKYEEKVYDKNIKQNKKKNYKKGLNLNDEQKLFETIKKMRKNNQTWNAVSDYLEKKNIPTLTGNGTWSPNLALYFYKKILSQNLKI